MATPVAMASCLRVSVPISQGIAHSTGSAVHLIDDVTTGAPRLAARAEEWSSRRGPWDGPPPGDRRHARVLRRVELE